MQDNGSLRLFRRGPAAEVRLVILVLAALALLITDARWQTLEPLRRAVSVGIYPFQRLVLAPRDAVSHVQYWIDGAAIARTEKEALQRQRIELAQIATHAAQLSTENEQLRRLLNVAGTVTQPSVAVEVLYEPANRYTRHLVFNKGESSGIRPGMPIIDEGGIVGQVVRVTPYTAEAAMLTDEAVSIPVQVMRNGLRLIAFGAGASVFPAGLSVASVDRIDHDTASGFAVGVATPLSHPERYRHFLVLLVENTFGAPGDAEGGVQ
jgi:rod shape-determining protein MreC